MAFLEDSVSEKVQSQNKVCLLSILAIENAQIGHVTRTLLCKGAPHDYGVTPMGENTQPTLLFFEIGMIDARGRLELGR